MAIRQVEAMIKKAQTLPKGKGKDKTLSDLKKRLDGLKYPNENVFDRVARLRREAQDVR